MDVGHVDDVPAEVALDGADDVTLLGGEDGVLKGLDHHAAAEEGEIAALNGGARVDGIFLGQFGEGGRIGLGLGEDFFGLLLGSGLVVAEADQDVAGTTLLSRGVALLVLFVIAANVLFIGLDGGLEAFGREDDVLGRDVLVGHELGLMAVVVGLDLIGRRLHVAHVLVDVEDERLDFTLFGDDLVQMLNDGGRHGIGGGHAREKSLLGEVAADFSHKLLVALALALEEALVERGRKLTVLLERIGVLDERNGFLLAHADMLSGNRLGDGGLVHQIAHEGFAGLRRVEHACTELVAHLLAKALELLALSLVEEFRRNGAVADLGDGVVSLGHAVVAVDARHDEARNNQHHGDEHQPALVIAKCLKHERFLVVLANCRPTDAERPRSR